MNITIETLGDKIIAHLIGRLDTANAEVFEKAIAPLSENADKELVLECAALEYISSSGLRQFLTLRKRVSASNGKLTIANLNGGLKDIFKMTGFSSIFDFA